MLENKGNIAVLSCNRKFKGEFECQDMIFWRKLGSLQLAGKISNFLWRACKDVLLTTTALVHKKIDMLVTCTWCHMHTEDAVHTLFNGYFARELWETVGMQQVVFAGEMNTIMGVFDTSSADQCVMVGLFC